MTYDGNGNPTTYKGETWAYDVENRVTAIGTKLTCGYRADNLRAWKQGSTGGKTYFLYDGGTPIIEMDSSGNVANINVFAPDGLVARKEGSTWTYYTFDQQGNVAQRLNSSQVVQTSRVFDAWGDGAETTTPRSYDCWNYNGKWGYYYDRETGLYYCQNRMYDSTTGRWINRDPIGYAGGTNLYGYCGGGPVGSADPSGLRQTGSYWGDVGQVFLGYGDAVTGMFNPRNNIEAFVLLTTDPGKALSGMLENLQFWNTTDPRVFGQRFAPWIPLIAGGLLSACELAGAAGAATGGGGASTARPAFNGRAMSPRESFPHYAPHPEGAPYTQLRPLRAGEPGVGSAVTYDSAGYGVGRYDFDSRTGRVDHPLPHFHEYTWPKNARNPLGSPSISKNPTPLPDPGTLTIFP